MKIIKEEWYNWLILIIPSFTFLMIFQQLPRIETLKFSFIEPYKIYNQFLLMYFGTIIFYTIILLRSKRTEHKGAAILKTLFVLFGITCSLLLLTIGIGLKIDFIRIIWILSGLFIIIYGNFFPVVKFKSILGIRNKWTNNNPNIWTMTHKITGRLWFTCGLVILVYSLVFNLSNTEFVFSILTFVLVFLPHLLSFILYKMISRIENAPVANTQYSKKR